MFLEQKKENKKLKFRYNWKRDNEMSWFSFFLFSPHRHEQQHGWFYIGGRVKMSEK